MGLTEIISILIYICIIAAVFWLIVWVLRTVGIPIPDMVLRIAGVVVFLLVLLWIIQRSGVSLSAP